MAHLKILPGCRMAAELSDDDDDDDHHYHRYGSGSGLRMDLHPLVGLADKKVLGIERSGSEELQEKFHTLLQTVTYHL